MLIDLLQKWHFPFNKIYEIIGMLCHHKSFKLHLGHFEGGEIILSPLNVLTMRTLRKLPQHNPIMHINIHIPILIIIQSHFL